MLTLLGARKHLLAIQAQNTPVAEGQDSALLILGMHIGFHHRGHGEEMQAKTVGQQKNRDLVIPAHASRSTFLCGLCGEFFLRGSRRRWPLVLNGARRFTNSGSRGMQHELLLEEESEQA